MKNVLTLAAVTLAVMVGAIISASLFNDPIHWEMIFGFGLGAAFAQAWNHTEVKEKAE